MNPTSVSVVIPTRDRAELLRAALDSIAASEWPGVVESIVVFDQSVADHSLATDDPHRPVRVLTNSRTPGLAGARNRGILAAASPWIAFCDDDDRWLPKRLNVQFAALEQVPGSCFATSGVLVEFDGVTHERIPSAGQLTFDGFLRDRMTEVHPSTFLMHREWLLDSVGLIDEALPGSYAEDYDLLLRVAKHTAIAVADEPVVQVLWHASTFFRDRWVTIDSALEYLLAKHPEFTGDARGWARIRGQQAFARAAAGQRRSALAAVGQTLRRNPLEPRAVLAAALVAGLSPSLVLEALHRFGRGV